MIHAGARAGLRAERRRAAEGPNTQLCVYIYITVIHIYIYIYILLL